MKGADKPASISSIFVDGCRMSRARTRLTDIPNGQIKKRIGFFDFQFITEMGIEFRKQDIFRTYSKLFIAEFCR